MQKIKFLIVILIRLKLVNFSLYEITNIFVLEEYGWMAKLLHRILKSYKK